ncbi:hypothetical protein SCATT_24800 [Streptantibioticus cattleyicolor NRRL 8057 = DSM 46488]|uniref:Uncharacterized protein n=1 Tax=Streptantibioticus cattleyicolor (strain ATCC 35852 / DSM 46488 / JCM 4925 / NBRC 14057 / NRRL 8057) TaxID=1003195 RepID=G8WU29_STREN|nr:hypothetical protein SCATT_24800 [Streptantibioticus cattleyicolor NRRL 8057 = DSM 46488]
MLVAAGMALTACGPNDPTAAAPGSSAGSSAATSSAQAGAQTPGKSGNGSSHASSSGTAKKPGVRCTDQINYAGDSRSNAEINSIGEQTGHCPAVSTSGSGGGSGSADAGAHSVYVGKLSYLAPGKLLVKPDTGGLDQAFFVSNATDIRGAAAICADNNEGHVTMDSNGYGTSKCTEEQLETAAKTGAVTVRVTMNPHSAGAESVVEKYHQ